MDYYTLLPNFAIFFREMKFIPAIVAFVGEGELARILVNDLEVDGLK